MNKHRHQVAKLAIKSRVDIQSRQLKVLEA